ncbi:MAG: FAD-dependent oxidoreductase, partial [Devosiaceae bacterium]|nr:FAD-dependent oxidoreductase [Devosiaceae bacterium]
LQLTSDIRLRFAGQISGVEGYVESAAMGLVTGRLAAADYLGMTISTPPKTSAMGSLVNHITGGHLVDESNGGGVPVSSTGQALVGSMAGVPGPGAKRPTAAGENETNGDKNKRDGAIFTIELNKAKTSTSLQ